MSGDVSDSSATSKALDREIAAWLASAQGRDRAVGTAASALELGRACWKLGRYADALVAFQNACARDASDPAPRIALMRASSMCAESSLEDAVVEAALARFPSHPDVVLHAALRDVPADLDTALSRLARLPAGHAATEHLNAVSTMLYGEKPKSNAMHPRAEAQRASFEWAWKRSQDSATQIGLPTRVLLKALDEAPEEGLTVECGVYFGRSLRIIAARSRGVVHGFDSFEGLPEAWSAQEPAGSYSTRGLMPDLGPQVRLHRGWFEETLPAFFERQATPVRLLHVDCDLYSSTRTALAAARPWLRPGSVVVFDDLLGYPGYEHHELRALEEECAASDLRWELLAACLCGREVAIRITS